MRAAFAGGGFVAVDRRRGMVVIARGCVQCVPWVPWVSWNTCRPTVTVRVALVLETTSGHSRLFHCAMNLNTASVATAGTAIGRMHP